MKFNKANNEHRRSNAMYCLYQVLDRLDYVASLIEPITIEDDEKIDEAYDIIMTLIQELK